MVLGSGRKGYGATRSTKGSPSGTRVMQAAASLGSAAGPANYNSSAPAKKVISKTRLAGQVNQDGQKNATGSQTARVKSNRNRGRKSKSRGKAGQGDNLVRNRDASTNQASGNGSSGEEMPGELSRPVPISPSKVKALSNQLNAGGHGNEYRGGAGSGGHLRGSTPAENFQEVGESDQLQHLESQNQIGQVPHQLKLNPSKRKTLGNSQLREDSVGNGRKRFSRGTKTIKT